MPHPNNANDVNNAISPSDANKQPDLASYINETDLKAMIARARREDLGAYGVDLTAAAAFEASKNITSKTSAGAGQKITAHLVARESGILAGANLIPYITAAFDDGIEVICHLRDGDRLVSGSLVATLTGSLKTVLMAERTMLNFINHLCGVATETHRYVTIIEGCGSKTKVCDTRKTIPCLRALQKYAVACGGGVNHRIGLFDAVLIKDNHIAHVPTSDLADYIGNLIFQANTLQKDINARHAIDGRIKFFQLEVDTLEQLELALPVQELNIILLDNMAPDLLLEAIKLRDQINPNIKLEASGGITLDTFEAVARTNVDRVSVGALTHSVRQLDLGLDISA